MGLDLYARIEEYLDFEEEVRALHKEFLTILSTKEPKSVIDIGCGQGAFLQHLNFNGVKAFGIDLSAEQIKICEEKDLNVACILLNEVKEKFDCATAIFDVINYIPKNELENFFKDCYNILNDNGYFIFDVNSLFGFEEVAQGTLTIDLEDKFIAIDANFEDNKLQTDITLFSQTKDYLFEKESDFITQYYYSKEFLKKSLEKTGFKTKEIIDFNLHDYENSDKLIFVCKK